MDMCGECLPEGLRRRCRPLPSLVAMQSAKLPSLVSERVKEIHSRDKDCSDSANTRLTSRATEAQTATSNETEVQTSELRTPEVVQVIAKIETVDPSVPLTDELLLARFDEITRLPNFRSLVVQRLMKRTLWLLRACSYPVMDICAILAHTSVYYREAIVESGREMNPLDMANVLIAFMYLSHCHIEDNTCPLAIWHRHLCKDYCSLKLFNVAILKLLSMRKYVLRVDQTQLALHLQVLQGRSAPAPADFSTSFWAGGTSPAQANDLAMSFWAESGQKPAAGAAPTHLSSPASTSSCAGSSMASPTSTAASAESAGSSSASADSTDDEQQ